MADIKRKQYLVKDFQTKFVLRFCSLVTLAVLLLAVGLYFWSADSTTTVFENSRLVVKSTQDFMLPTILVMTLVSIFLACLVSIVTIFLFSHRVAGPMIRIESHLKGMSEGQLSRKVMLRSSDEIQDVADAVNDMMMALASRVDEFKQEFARLEKIDRDLVALWESKRVGHKKLEPVICELKEIEASLQEKLDYFRT